MSRNRNDADTPAIYERHLRLRGATSGRAFRFERFQQGGNMNRLLAAAALLFAAGLGIVAAIAANTTRNDQVTVAVFGDWPYADAAGNRFLLENAPLLIDSINADPDVGLVIHVGDIHSGSEPCTSAGILPPIAKSIPDWNQGIFYQFQQFAFPVVYTPGDNEWSDCHKSKQSTSGHPLKELTSVRQLFFSQPGHTLGGQDKEVSTQKFDFDPAHPDDAQFVENVMWEDAKVLFVTVNIPGGSNNDLSPWTAPFNTAADKAAQATERAQRTAADIRWLTAAFDTARANKDKAVVVALQADMWDPEALPSVGGAGLDQYTPFVQALADKTAASGLEVLVLNGDTHLFKVDKSLANANSDTGKIHHTQAVPNLTRITVQGSTNSPAEWLKLTIDGRKPYPFSWQNKVYCQNPLSEVCKP
jgi:hypothetical protein